MALTTRIFTLFLTILHFSCGGCRKPPLGTSFLVIYDKTVDNRIELVGHLKDLERELLDGAKLNLSKVGGTKICFAYITNEGESYPERCASVPTAKGRRNKNFRQFESTIKGHFASIIQELSNNNVKYKASRYLEAITGGLLKFDEILIIGDMLVVDSSRNFEQSIFGSTVPTLDNLSSGKIINYRRISKSEQEAVFISSVERWWNYVFWKNDKKEQEHFFFQKPNIQVSLNDGTADSNQLPISKPPAPDTRPIPTFPSSSAIDQNKQRLIKLKENLKKNAPGGPLKSSNKKNLVKRLRPRTLGIDHPAFETPPYDRKTAKNPSHGSPNFSISEERPVFVQKEFKPIFGSHFVQRNRRSDAASDDLEDIGVPEFRQEPVHPKADSVRMGGLHTVDSLSVKQALSRESIYETIIEQQEQLRACYEYEINRGYSDLSGEIVTVFLINQVGKVTESRIESSSLDRSSVEKCVLTVLNKIQFPIQTLEGLIEVRFPFKFRIAERSTG